MSHMDFRITPHRARILSILRQGDIEDLSGYASPILREQTGHRSHNALAAVLLQMENAGLLLRDMNGRRTYRIALTTKGRQVADLLADKSAAQRIEALRLASADPYQRDTDSVCGGCLDKVAEVRRLQAEVGHLRDVIDILLDKLATRS